MYSEDLITEIGPDQLWSLKAVDGWQEFQDDTSLFKPQNYLWDAQRFSHKSYALLDAFRSKHRYVVWLDSDTMFQKKVTEGWLKGLLKGKMCAYLGREGCYTETGFLIFDTYHRHFARFREEFGRQYNLREIFFHDIWVDCVAFDTAIEGLDCENLTPQAKGMVAVFEDSPLSDHITHNKGGGHGKYKEAA